MDAAEIVVGTGWLIRLQSLDCNCVRPHIAAVRAKKKLATPNPAGRRLKMMTRLITGNGRSGDCFGAIIFEAERAGGQA
jgi:hypothetical protein